MQNDEFERTPVTPGRLQPARHFAANYAGEHVAGTEFVIGAMFVAWGVSTGDILWGLLWGNLMAVLSWGLVCAPIAVQTRLTLYAYLEKIGGPGMIRVYSVVNGVLFCILAGTMITVSASAMRIPLGIAPQVDWYPTSVAFVALVLVIGAVVVWIALRGFRGVARFATVCAPWMVLMFVLGAMAMLPVLAASTDGVQASSGIADFGTIADRWIWQGTGAGSVGMWHVAAFAWICNLAMHGGLSDMSVLRFARSPSYGFLSANGMFIGHYMAWVCAGIMGAGAALLLKSSISVLDPGAVAYQALGSAGIVAVIVAGWTTANPTIYRAGLAFQSLNPRWGRARVTMITGGVTTVIACFPFVFSRLMDFVGIMGLTLAPVGAVIVAEHWLFPRLGLTRYWSHYAGLRANFAALAAWALSLLLALALVWSGAMHLFFLLIPTWIAATVIYIVLASFSGARVAHAEQAARDEGALRQQQAAERQYLDNEQLWRASTARASANPRLQFSRLFTLLALACCVFSGLAVFNGTIELATLRDWLIAPTVIYLVAATIWMREKECRDSEIPPA